MWTLLIITTSWWIISPTPEIRVWLDAQQSSVRIERVWVSDGDACADLAQMTERHENGGIGGYQTIAVCIPARSADR